MSVKKIEYCLGNLEQGSKLVFETIKAEFPEITQRRWACLGNCSECFKKPFVLIDEKEILAGETAEELMEKVRGRILAP